MDFEMDADAAGAGADGADGGAAGACGVGGLGGAGADGAGGDSGFGALTEMASSSDPETRGRLAATLGMMQGDRAFGMLVDMLSDSDMRVRATAAMALGQQGSPHAVEALLPLLEEGSAQMTCTVIAALARLGDERSFAPIVSRLFDVDDEVRKNAAGAIGSLRDPRALEPLRMCLGDQVEWVRANSALSLGKIGCPEAVGDLVKLADSADTPLVRANAVSGVGQIGLDAQDGELASYSLGYVLDVMGDAGEDDKVRIAAMLVFGESFERACEVAPDIAASAFAAIEDMARGDAGNADAAGAAGAAGDAGTAGDGADVKSTAIWCLGKACSAQTVEHAGISQDIVDEVFDILNLALHDGSEWCVRYAVEALADLGEPRCAEAIRDFAVHADQSYMQLCVAALRSFSNADRRPSATRGLQRSIADDHPQKKA